jgi:glycosyltransferase involved in cell wall biosynthesis
MPHVLLASPNTQYILDSIYFNKITRPDEQIPRNCIGLVHHLESLVPLSDKVFENGDRKILSRFSGLLVTSTFTQQFLVERGFNPLDITVIEPAPMMQPMIREPQAKVRSLILGSCIPRKGQLEFLEVLAASAVPPYYSLTIAGSTTADKAYTQACQELVVKSPALTKCVRFAGEQDSDIIRKLYEHSNLYISSSVMETFGMAIQDAVASGMPVLAREGGYAARHVSTGENGYTSPEIKGVVNAFQKCVTDQDYFLLLQRRAQVYIPNYITWAKGAELFVTRFLNEPV